MWRAVSHWVYARRRRCPMRQRQRCLLNRWPPHAPTAQERVPPPSGSSPGWRRGCSRLSGRELPGVRQGRTSRIRRACRRRTRSRRRRRPTGSPHPDPPPMFLRAVVRPERLTPRGAVPRRPGRLAREPTALFRRESTQPRALLKIAGELPRGPPLLARQRTQR